MAAGEYVSVSSQADTERADLGRERQELAQDPAAELAELEAVLFIDAWLAPAGGPPQLVELIPAGAGAPDTHRLEPAELLAISQALYGRAPAACLLQVPAHAFEHGNTLSAQLQAALPQAQALMQGWLAHHA